MQIYGDRLSAVYLYGSYARGDYREDSDIDLMIALKGEVNPTQEIDRLSKVLSDISLDYGLLIATYPVSEAWLQERHGPLFANVRRLPNPTCMITRFRLDAGLYELAPARKAHQRGRTRVKGQRLPTLETIAQQRKTRWTRVMIPDWYSEGARTIELVSATAVWYHSGQPPVPIRWVLIRDPKGKFKTQALLCTDLTVKPVQIIKWFVLRWQLEVTFREVRAHLGVETQRHWSDLAIARTTPALLGLFSLVTVLAHQRTQRKKLPMRPTARYRKPRPTFSDALAVVRHSLWCHVDLSLSPKRADSEKHCPNYWNASQKRCVTPDDDCPMDKVQINRDALTGFAQFDENYR